MNFREIASGVFLFLVSLLFTSNVFSQDPDFHIYIAFGQSNMEGQGAIQAQDKTVDNRFQVMEAVNCTNLNRKKGTWYTAVPPLTRCYSGLSPLDYFGRTLVDSLPANIKVGVINVSVAGCKIELFDKDNYETYASTVESWMKNIINEYDGNPYGHLVEMAKLAQADGVIKGILLHQGESNTGDSKWPAKVKKIYNNLMTDLALNPDSVPLLAGEVVHADQGGVCASMNSIIAKLPQSIANAHIISSSKCTAATDKLHFNTAGYRELGVRYGLKMLSLLDIPETSTVGIASLETLNDYALENNYPNPFTDRTSISFEIPRSAHVSLKVYNILGFEVAELAGKEFPQGKHKIEFHAENHAKGIYFYTLKANSFFANQKMIIQ